MTIRKTVFCLAFSAIAVQASAQINFTGSYTQDFDSLLNTGTSNAWTDNSTIAGWYIRRMNDVNLVLSQVYNAGDGGSNAGALYSFGSAGSNERALGSIASGSVEHLAYGARLTNNTGGVINEFTLSYTGEQWRDGNNLTQHTLLFSYKIGGDNIGEDLQPGGGTAGYTADPTFTRFAGLDFTGPIATSVAGALDGNLPANQAAISNTVTGLTWNPGEDLWIRWVDLNDVGNDHGLAVDNLEFTANPVPEPGSMIALAMGGLGLLARRRRKA
jgi:hypothetical protein